MPRRVEVLDRANVFADFFQIDRVTLRYEQFDGRMSRPVTRLVLERGDAAAVLLYDRAQRQVILVQQFRYPAYVRGGPGWLWEVVAGICKPGQNPEEVARNEALEEAGYCLDALRYVMTVYPSPGGSSERVHLYLAPVTPAQRVTSGGGLEEDNEDILVHAFELDEAVAMIRDGRLVDAKTVVLLQYLAAHWDEV